MVGSPNLRQVDNHGLSMRIAEQGEGPLVLLLHGFPESWYSWRHQLPALAEAGYRVVAPDLRGYGRTDAPAAIDEYDIHHLCADVVGLIDLLAAEQAVVVGHDWGALLAWSCVLLEPARFRGLVALSVPYLGRSPVSPIEAWKRRFGEDFFYILYFQEPGVAETEFDADPRGLLRRLYTSPDTPREAPTITDSKRSAGGWIPRLGLPREPAGFLSAEDLHYYVAEFERTGFRGGVNYYRNFDRNWRLLEGVDPKVSQPTLFIAGARDPVIAGATAEALRQRMAEAVPDLRGVELLAGIGHWVQQERPDEVNRLLIAFLRSL